MLIQKLFALLGRLCLSTIFILSAVSKIFDWQKAETGLMNLFSDWQTYVSSSGSMAKMFSGLISITPEILIIAVVVELIGGLMVFFGLKVRIGVFLLIIFFLPATILLHPFWYLDGSKSDAQMVIFLKNIAILGGLLYVLVFGSKIKPKITMPLLPPVLPTAFKKEPPQ